MRIALAAAALVTLAGCPSDDATPPEGAYSLTWTCVVNCEIEPPIFTASEQVSIVGARATWEGANGHPESDIVVDATLAGDCLHHDAANANLREQFDLCADACDGVECVTAEISWDYPSRRTWSVIGTLAQ